MDAQQSEAIAQARAAGARVTITTVHIDFGDRASSPAGGDERSGSDVGETAHLELTAVDHIRAEPDPLRLAEWADLLPALSQREIERAVKAGALTARAKGRGPDHMAKVIEPDDMLHYVQTCQRIQAGEQEKPDWWDTVRRSTNNHISKPFQEED